MTANDRFLKAQSLDPANWDELTATGHRMLDDMMAFLKNIRNHKIGPLPEEAINKIQQPLPLKPQGYKQVYEEFLQNVLPYPVPGIHPHFWGFVMGTGSPLGVLAEILAATMNGNISNFFAPYQVEKQVIEWLKEIMDW